VGFWEHKKLILEHLFTDQVQEYRFQEQILIIVGERWVHMFLE